MLRWNAVFVMVSLDALSIDLSVKIDIISGLGHLLHSNRLQ